MLSKNSENPSQEEDDSKEKEDSIEISPLNLKQAEKINLDILLRKSSTDSRALENQRASYNESVTTKKLYTDQQPASNVGNSADHLVESSLQSMHVNGQNPLAEFADGSDTGR